MDYIKERAERLKTIALEMDSIIKEIGPKWIKLAHLRKESQEIIEEMQNVKIEGLDEKA